MTISSNTVLSQLSNTILAVNSSGLIISTTVTGGSGGGIGGTINAASQFSLPYYSLAGSTTTLSAFPGVTASTNTGIAVSTMSVSSMTVTNLTVAGTGNGQTVYTITGSTYGSVASSTTKHDWPLFAMRGVPAITPLPWTAERARAVARLYRQLIPGQPRRSLLQADSFIMAEGQVTLLLDW